MSAEKETPAGDTPEPLSDGEAKAEAAAPEVDEPVESKQPKSAPRGRSLSSLPTPLDTFAVVEASWGYPSFARELPRHPELDALVAAFARGDYRTVRDGAAKLAASATDDRVKQAARTLRERIEPDPTSKLLFLLAAGLLAFLTYWWVTHDGPDGGDAPALRPTATSRHAG
jgi:hypothetical protein